MSYPLIEGITKDPAELQRLSQEDIKALCAEMRAFLIEKLSKTGGHLASNLGIVEISVALALEFDLMRDRIFYDVGHQCYIHKILTGRMAGFDTLRQFGGLSGFPKPKESPADAFVAGHASNALSAAVGFARAYTITHDKRHVVAVVGDAAITGGMAVEALNDIGRSEEPVIVILNDNAMAISRSVGAIAEHLTRLRTRPGYFRLKTFVKKNVGERFGGFLKRIKARVRSLFLPASILEDMGFIYLGPVNGHDIQSIRSLLSFAKLLERPVVIHCMTVKGYGSAYAEKNPDRFHGASAFDALSGRELAPKRRGFSDAFGEEIVSLARNDPRICAITAAMTGGTGLKSFAEAYPERFFDVGIAEQHAVTLSAGLAKAGMTPVCAIYSTFLQRAYDQILHDVCLDPVHIIFAVDRAGLVPGDGETHQGLFDIQYLGGAPGMTLYAPSNLEETRFALKRCIEVETGPCALRYPRGGEGQYLDCRFDEASGDAFYTTVFPAELPEAVIICYGSLVNEAITAAQRLERDGIAVQVIKLFRLFPLPKLDFLTRYPLIIAEEAMQAGSIGERLLSEFALSGKTVRAKLINAGTRYLPCGSVADLRKLLGLDADGLYTAVKQLTGRV